MHKEYGSIEVRVREWCELQLIDCQMTTVTWFGPAVARTQQPTYWVGQACVTNSRGWRHVPPGLAHRCTTLGALGQQLHWGPLYVLIFKHTSMFVVFLTIHTCMISDGREAP